jgi:hypothetical protein
MVKKKKSTVKKEKIKQDTKEEKSNFMENLKEFLYSTFTSLIKGSILEGIDNLKHEIRKAQKLLIKNISLASFLILGGIFVLIGIVLLVNEYMKLSMSWSFFLVGLIIMVITLLMKNSMESN